MANYSKAKTSDEMKTPLKAAEQACYDAVQNSFFRVETRSGQFSVRPVRSSEETPFTHKKTYMEVIQL